jgi:organic hydroperoxide reductase OsmC/OhrA
MAEHRATISWTRKSSPEDFTKGKYSREHAWTFDGGVTVPGSSSPAVVPVPWSNPSAVDPEEALVAAISSCHMLTFVYLAQKAGFVVDAYEDAAVGTMTKTERGGTPWVSHVTLTPRIVWGGEKPPTAAELEHLHHQAHEQCFIAQSVKTEITVARPS